MKPSLLDAVRASASARESMIKRFGFMPNSIIRIGRGALSKSMFVYQTEKAGRSLTTATPERALPSDEWDVLTEAAKQRTTERRQLNVVGGAVGQTRKVGKSLVAASIMPAELVDFFVKYYAEDGQVYLDPFMGQGIQMQVAKRHGMSYYGYDLSDEFFAYIDAVRQKIDDGMTVIQTTLGDSCSPTEIPDGIGDFCFTSPPYWDVEWYGDDPRQLGIGKSYDEFLAGMGRVAAAWRPKFKPGAWIVINVGDIRRDKVFYPYHADTIRLFMDAGYTMHDTWIIDGLVGGISRVWAVQRNTRRITPRVHEYALVFRA